MLLVQGLEQAQRAGHADAQAAEDGLLQWARLALDQERSGRGGGRRRLAAVVALELFGGVPVQDEGTAADPRRLRLDQVQHELHGDRGIGGAAARAQHLEARLHGQGIGRRNHVGLGRGGAGASNRWRPRVPPGGPGPRRESRQRERKRRSARANGLDLIDMPLVPVQAGVQSCAFFAAREMPLRVARTASERPLRACPPMWLKSHRRKKTHEFNALITPPGCLAASGVATLPPFRASGGDAGS